MSKLRCEICQRKNIFMDSLPKHNVDKINIDNNRAFLKFSKFSFVCVVFPSYFWKSL